MIIQLNPPIPLQTPKGNGFAHLVIDYGCEFNLMWTVIIDETSEIWTFQNSDVRGQKNIIMGRTEGKSGKIDFGYECQHSWVVDPYRYCYRCVKCNMENHDVKVSNNGN